MAPRAILFDKDGTLFDLQATWAPATEQLIAELAGKDEDIAARLARDLGYDRLRHRLLAGSVIVAETPEAVVEVVASSLEAQSDRGRLCELVDRIGRETAVVQVDRLEASLADLRARGVRLACITNDSAAAAHAHLSAAGVAALFDVVIGFDSGYSAKPSPAPLIAAARILGVRPSEALMVGDTRHDLDAARRAGMPAVGVLTGASDRANLAPHCIAVLPSIAHLPAWIDSA